MTVDDDKKTDSKKSGSQKDSDQDDLDELDLDLDLDDEDLSLDFTDLEDIDLADIDEDVETAEVGVNETGGEAGDKTEIEDIDAAEEILKTTNEKEKENIEPDKDDLPKNTKHLLKKYKKVKVDRSDKLPVDGDSEEITKESDQFEDVEDLDVLDEKVDEKLKDEYLARLSLIEFKIEELGNLGLDVNLIQDLVNDAKKRIAKNDLNGAKPLINNSDNLSSGILTEHRMNLISTIISFIETFVFELTDLELDFGTAEKHFNQAKEQLKYKDLVIANESLNQAIQNISKTLNESREDKIEEAYKIFEFWFNEVSDFDLDHKKLKNISSDSKKAFDADDMETAEEYLEKLTYSSKAEINKLEMGLDQKEDYIQQLDGIYNFEDYSSLGDAIARAKNMLDESLDKGIIQEKLNDLINIYNLIIESQTKEDRPDINGIMTKFSEAKDAFEKEDYPTMEKVLKKLSQKLGVPDSIPAKQPEPEIKTKTEEQADEEPMIDPQDRMRINSEFSDIILEIESLSKDGFDIGALKLEVDKAKEFIEADDIEPTKRLLEELKNRINDSKEEKAREEREKELEKEKEQEKGKELEKEEIHEEEKITVMIAELESNIKAAQNDGIKTNVTEDLLNYGRQRFKTKKYMEVTEIIEHASDVLENTIKEEKEKKLKQESSSFIKFCHKKIESLPEKQPGIDNLIELFEKIQGEANNKNYSAVLKLKEEFGIMFEKVKTAALPGGTEDDTKEVLPSDMKDYYDEFRKFELENSTEIVEGGSSEPEVASDRYGEIGNQSDEVYQDEETDQCEEDDQDLEDLDFDPDIAEIEEEFEDKVDTDIQAEDVDSDHDTATSPQEQDGAIKNEVEHVEEIEPEHEGLSIKSDVMTPPEMSDVSEADRIEPDLQIQQTDNEIKIELEEKFDGDISIEAKIDPDPVQSVDNQNDIEGEADDNEVQAINDDEPSISAEDGLPEQKEIIEATDLNKPEDQIESIENGNIEIEKINEPRQGDNTGILEIPNTTELIKEAFGFKISSGTGVFSPNGVKGNLAGADRTRSSNQQMQDPQEIQQIRKKVLTKLEDKRSGRKMNRPLFPHEIREINRQKGQGLDQHEPLEEYPEQTNNIDQIDHMDEYMEERRNKNNQIPSKYNNKSRVREYETGPVPISNELQYPDYGPGPQQYRNQRAVLEQPPRTGRQQVQPTINRNGHHHRSPRGGLQVMHNFQGVQNINGIKGMEGLEHGETQDQYETRINSLKKGALKGLQEIQSIISDTYYFGATIDELERISEDARNAFDDRDYQEVLLYVDKCEELSRQLKLGYMERLIAEFKQAGENSEYMEYLFRETENAYNDEKYKLGDELARRFINVTKDLEFEEKITNQTWMYCRYCGNNIQRDSTFCSHCGERLY
jgi:hypothetical protein